MKKLIDWKTLQEYCGLYDMLAKCFHDDHEDNGEISGIRKFTECSQKKCPLWRILESPREGCESDGSQEVVRMKCVLIVDDQKNMINTIRFGLKRYGFDIRSASSAEEASDLMGKMSFDAVITDMEMGGENGLWLLERVREKCPKAARILMAGDPFFDYEEELVHYLFEKPIIDFEIIKSIVDGMDD